MHFRCPSCGFTGGVKVPPHFPKGKVTRIRCARCNHSFSLALGRLWPQDSAEAYEALVPGSRDCRGERIGRLWLEIAGTTGGSAPVLVLQPLPSLSHELMHDLVDPFGDFFPVCYLEFPGSKKNPAPPSEESPLELILGSLDSLKSRLKASRIHLLGHLDSCRLALRIAEARPKDIASLILIEPELAVRERWQKLLRSAGAAAGQPQGLDASGRAELIDAIGSKYWQLSLEEHHLGGLLKVLSAGFSPALLSKDDPSMLSYPAYARLTRMQMPAIIFSSRDGSAHSRDDALYLQSSLPAGELAPLEKGGAMAAWFGGSWFSNKLLSFKRSAEKPAEKARKKTQIASGQPLGWILALFAALTWGLAAGLSFFTFQPDFMRQVIPVFLGSFLPILWFLVPRKLNPLALLRFRAFTAKTVLLPFAVGALLGFAFWSLLAGQAAWRPPDRLPGILISLALGSGGRPYYFLSLVFSTLLCFGLAENLLGLRRSGWKLIVPILSFALVPFSLPDALWRLPAAAAAALLFANGLSVYAPLFLLAGVFFGSELPADFPAATAFLAGFPGWVLSLAFLVGAAFVTAFAITGRRGFTSEALYYAGSLNKPEKVYRWQPALGLVLVIFSLIAAVALVFGFLKV